MTPSMVEFKRDCPEKPIVIPNLFRDNAQLLFVIPKQVRDDEAAVR
jgi:hypothetical protein